MKVRIWAVFISLLLALGLFMSPVDVVASEEKVIKIGYIDYDGFIEEDDGIYSGYVMRKGLKSVTRYMTIQNTQRE